MTLERRDELSASERAVIDGMAEHARDVPARRDFVTEGDRPNCCCLMLSGLSARYNLISDGRRQISAIHIPGDFDDDDFVIRAGCDKRLATCGANFGNVANFRGFPHIPGQDAVIRYVTQDGGHEGAVL